MGFAQGHKLSGSRKGCKNIKTEYWDNFKQYILSTGLRNLEKDMENLQPKDRVYAVISMMEYFKPKLSRNQNINEVEKETLAELTKLYRTIANAAKQTNEGLCSGELQG